MKNNKTNPLSLWGSAGAVAAALLLAACGGDGGGASAAGSGELTETEKSRIAEEYRDCMAEGGMDATVNFDGGGLGIDVSGGDDLSQEEMLEFEATCEVILAPLDASGPQMSPEEEAQLVDAAYAVQKCVAEEGYVVEVSPDGGIGLNSDDQPEGFDEAVYLEVEDACFQEAVPELYAKYGPGSE